LSATYLEVDFQIGNQRQLKDILIAELSEINFESFMDHENGFHGYIQEDLFEKEKLDIVLNAQQNTINFVINIILPQNWNATWEAQFEPIEINEYCIIRAPFHPPATNKHIELIIEPKMSFGTGHHATTRMMCLTLFDLDVKGKNVLDMGCGTGILGILAAKLGANCVTGIDIESWAIENTLENALRNNVEMNAFLGNAEQIPKRKFEVILANINRNILINDADLYMNSLETKGFIALSGFLQTDESAIISHFNSLGALAVSIKKEENWRCILLQKSN
jgi:ribosomal protein L11 methyltransferase